jgi:hypothetical protein
MGDQVEEAAAARHGPGQGSPPWPVTDVCPFCGGVLRLRRLRKADPEGWNAPWSAVYLCEGCGVVEERY